MRGVLRFVVLLIVVLAIAYLGAWWYVQGRMAVAFRAQEQVLRAAGWTVSHGAVARGSSPLVASYAVDDLSLMPPDRGMPTPRITLPQVVLRVRPTAPFTLDVGLPLAWHIAMAQGPAFTLRFATISDRYGFDPNAVLDHAPNPWRQGMLDFTGMRMDSADTNFTLVSIASFAGTVTRDPAADKGSTALTVHEALSGLALSPIFVTLAHLPFDGKLGALGLDASFSGPALPSIAPSALLAGNGGAAPGVAVSGVAASGIAAWNQLGPAMHHWAQAGGHGHFAVTLALGPLHAKTDGDIGFDPSVQPDGKATLVADGVGAFFGDIANAYPAAVGMISALSAQTAPYMSKGPDTTKTGADAQRLTVAFGLAGGVLTANGKKVADVPPVVWPPASPTPSSVAKPAP
jgi:hypothetical protein